MSSSSSQSSSLVSSSSRRTKHLLRDQVSSTFSCRAGTSCQHPAIHPLFIIFLLAIALTWQPVRGDPDFWIPKSGNDTIPLISAKEYLAKFGWVEPSDWTAISPSLRHIFQQQRPTENLLTRLGGKKEADRSSTLKGFAASGISTADVLLRAMTSSAAAATSGVGNGDEVSDDRFKEALKSFQRANGLAVTGQLDEATSMVMQQPRCGVPDKTTAGNVSVIDGQVKNFFEVIITMNETADNNRDHQAITASDLASGVGSSDDQEESSGSEEDERERSERRRSVTELTEAEEVPYERTHFLEKELNELRTQWSHEPPRTDPLSKKSKNNTRILGRLMERKERAGEVKSRQKRSDLFKLVNEWKIPGKNVITWRLSNNWPSTNPYMTPNEVWFTLRLAFRMWSEVLPRTFRESPASEGSDEYVDILLGFAVGQHNECPATFDTTQYVREFAHAWPLPWAQVHFNDLELFVPFSWQTPHRLPSDVVLKANRLPISLLKVALHEIGHALGLKHSNNRSSIMYPFYKPFQDEEIVELSDADRRMVREIYGPCSTRIDSMFDMVFVTQNEKGELFLKYNTFIFRRGWFWLYKNQHRRPQYGYPKLITKYWRNLMLNAGDYNSGIDAAVQTREPNFYGVTLFFIGEYFAEYDMALEKMKEMDSHGNRFPLRITDVFKRGPKTVDAAMFKYQENLLYLFKGAYVYRYRWPQRTLYDKNLISIIFPMLTQSMFRRGYKLQSVDAAYYSLHDNAYYLFKGETYWKVNTALGRRLSTSNYIFNGQRIIRYINPLGPGQLITKKWLHVCDVGPQEIHMSLPEA